MYFTKDWPQAVSLVCDADIGEAKQIVTSGPVLVVVCQRGIQLWSAGRVRARLAVWALDDVEDIRDEVAQDDSAADSAPGAEFGTSVLAPCPAVTILDVAVCGTGRHVAVLTSTHRLLGLVLERTPQAGSVSEAAAEVDSAPFAGGLRVGLGFMSPPGSPRLRGACCLAAGPTAVVVGTLDGAVSAASWRGAFQGPVKLAKHRSAVSSLALLSTRSLLVACFADGRACAFTVGRNGSVQLSVLRLLVELYSPLSGAVSVAVSPRGPVAAVGFDDGTVALHTIDVPDGLSRVGTAITQSSGATSSAAPSAAPSGRDFVVASSAGREGDDDDQDDGANAVLRAQDSASAASAAMQSAGSAGDSAARRLSTHVERQGFVGALQHSDEMIMSPAVRSRPLHQPACVLSMATWGITPDQTGRVLALSWSPDARALCVGSSRGGLSLWTMSGYRLLSTFREVDAKAAGAAETEHHQLARTSTSSVPGRGATGPVPALLAGRVPSVAWGPHGFALFGLTAPLGHSPSDAPATPAVLVECRLLKLPVGSHRVPEPPGAGVLGPGGSAAAWGGRSEGHLLVGADRIAMLCVDPGVPGAAREGAEGQRGGLGGMGRGGEPRGAAAGPAGQHAWVSEVCVPEQYLRPNWPVRVAAASASTMLFVVAGLHGLAVHDRQAGKWHLWGDLSEESSFSCTGVCFGAARGAQFVAAVTTKPRPEFAYLDGLGAVKPNSMPHWGPQSGRGYLSRSGSRKEQQHAATLRIVPARDLSNAATIATLDLEAHPSCVDVLGADVMLLYPPLDITVARVQPGGSGQRGRIEVLRSLSLVTTALDPLTDACLVPAWMLHESDPVPTPPCAPENGGAGARAQVDTLPSHCLLLSASGELQVLSMVSGAERHVGSGVEVFWIASAKATGTPAAQTTSSTLGPLNLLSTPLSQVPRSRRSSHQSRAAAARGGSFRSATKYLGGALGAPGDASATALHTLREEIAYKNPRAGSAGPFSGLGGSHGGGMSFGVHSGGGSGGHGGGGAPGSARGRAQDPVAMSRLLALLQAPDEPWPPAWQGGASHGGANADQRPSASSGLLSWATQQTAPSRRTAPSKSHAGICGTTASATTTEKAPEDNPTQEPFPVWLSTPRGIELRSLQPRAPLRSPAEAPPVNDDAALSLSTVDTSLPTPGGTPKGKSVRVDSLVRRSLRAEGSHSSTANEAAPLSALEDRRLAFLQGSDSLRDSMGPFRAASSRNARLMHALREAGEANDGSDEPEHPELESDREGYPVGVSGTHMAAVLMSLRTVFATGTGAAGGGWASPAAIATDIAAEARVLAWGASAGAQAPAALMLPAMVAEPSVRTLLPCLFRRLLASGAEQAACDLAAAHAASPGLPGAAELLLLTVLHSESSAPQQTEEDRVRGWFDGKTESELCTGDALLRGAVRLLRQTECFGAAVVCVARKTDPSRWVRLFDAVGPPSGIVEDLLSHGERRLASCGLLVVDRLEGANVACGLALRIADQVLEFGEYDVAAELIRFLAPGRDNAGGTRALVQRALKGLDIVSPVTSNRSLERNDSSGKQRSATPPQSPTERLRGILRAKGAQTPSDGRTSPQKVSLDVPSESERPAVKHSFDSPHASQAKKSASLRLTAEVLELASPPRTRPGHRHSHVPSFLDGLVPPEDEAFHFSPPAHASTPVPPSQAPRPPPSIDSSSVEIAKFTGSALAESSKDAASQRASNGKGSASAQSSRISYASKDVASDDESSGLPNAHPVLRSSSKQLRNSAEHRVVSLVEGMAGGDSVAGADRAVAGRSRNGAAPRTAAMAQPVQRRASAGAHVPRFHGRDPEGPAQGGAGQGEGDGGWLSQLMEWVAPRPPIAPRTPVAQEADEAASGAPGGVADMEGAARNRHGRSASLAASLASAGRGSAFGSTMVGSPPRSDAAREPGVTGPTRRLAHPDAPPLSPREVLEEILAHPEVLNLPEPPVEFELMVLLASHAGGLLREGRLSQLVSLTRSLIPLGIRPASVLRLAEMVAEIERQAQDDDVTDLQSPGGSFVKPLFTFSPWEAALAPANVPPGAARELVRGAMATYALSVARDEFGWDLEEGAFSGGGAASVGGTGLEGDREEDVRLGTELLLDSFDELECTVWVLALATLLGHVRALIGVRAREPELWGEFSRRVRTSYDFVAFWGVMDRVKRVT
ncbi:unnamed protein product [Pedinophyceae sp. YPF-701]|nr:unnamed protein product [Pedinophyceae sp. YPF-701]